MVLTPTSAKIKKAVFPVAGLGTRFLPATKACPKEMLAIVDKPLIQYAVEEAIAAGMTDLIFITGRNKRSIEDHFDTAYELEAELAASGRDDILDIVHKIRPDGINFIFIRQNRPLGLGHAVLCAKPVIGNEAFAVVLADDLVDSQTPVLAQMLKQYQTHQCAIVGVQTVDRMATQSYGIIEPQPLGDHIDRVKAIVEKPAPEQAPSTTAVIGRYILTPAIFDYLEQIGYQQGKEIQLTDAISALLTTETVLAYHFTGTRYDCGAKEGFLAATVAYGLKHPEVGDNFRKHLRALADSLKD